MTLKKDFKKGSNAVRFIRGSLELKEGKAFLNASYDQGNIVISSAINCNAYGIIPPNVSPVLSGETVEGFLF